MDKYDAQTIEPKWQRVWEETRAGGSSQRAEVLCARDAAVPVGLAAHRARPRLHVGRRPRALLSPDGLGGAASDGLRLLRVAGGERGDQRGRASTQDRRAQHRTDPGSDETPGLGDRLVARVLDARARVLPLDA